VAQLLAHRDLFNSRVLLVPLLFDAVPHLSLQLRVLLLGLQGLLFFRLPRVLLLGVAPGCAEILLLLLLLFFRKPITVTVIAVVPCAQVMAALRPLVYTRVSPSTNEARRTASPRTWFSCLWR